MRKILCRGKWKVGGLWGKWKTGGSWVEGYFVKTDAACYIFTGRYDYQNSGPIQSFEWFRVDPDTVGQYTGLTDKNGRKIYEGDIIERSGTTLRYEVVFEDRYDRAYFGVKNEDETWPFPVAIPSIQMEVVGNIWDNPELMEAEP